MGKGNQLTDNVVSGGESVLKNLYVKGYGESMCSFIRRRVPCRGDSQVKNQHELREYQAKYMGPVCRGPSRCTSLYLLLLPEASVNTIE